FQDVRTSTARGCGFLRLVCLLVLLVPGHRLHDGERGSSRIRQDAEAAIARDVSGGNRNRGAELLRARDRRVDVGDVDVGEPVRGRSCGQMARDAATVDTATG